MVHSEKKSSTLLIAISWIIVLVPLGWGVVQSIGKSLPLLQTSSGGKADGHRVMTGSEATPRLSR
jgi:hypothetical protein